MIENGISYKYSEDRFVILIVEQAKNETNFDEAFDELAPRLKSEYSISSKTLKSFYTELQYMLKRNIQNFYVEQLD